MIGTEQGGDTVRHEVVPPPHLVLVVGELDHEVWVSVGPEHAEYDRFRGAQLLQADWDWDTHSWFWRTNLKLWPMDRRKLSTSGLTAQRVAQWRRAGYSQNQIATALGYTDRGGVTDAIWHLADSYLDWLAQRPFLHPAGIGAMTFLENMYSEAFEREQGPAAAESFRRNYRILERTPRIVNADGRYARGFARFGHPDEYSATCLDRIDPRRATIRANLNRAEAALVELKSRRGVAPQRHRNPHFTVPTAS